MCIYAGTGGINAIIRHPVLPPIAFFGVIGVR